MPKQGSEQAHHAAAAPTTQTVADHPDRTRRPDLPDTEILPRPSWSLRFDPHISGKKQQMGTKDELYEIR